MNEMHRKPTARVDAPPRRIPEPADPCVMVIFGAGGDLTHRLLMPALYNLAQFSEALVDGQFPVRWLPDLFGGRGSPHFVYYHPLAFYLGALLRGLGLGTLVALRLLDLGALALSGWALARWLDAWLPRAAATLGGVAYLLAPIRIVETEPLTVDIGTALLVRRGDDFFIPEMPEIEQQES